MKVDGFDALAVNVAYRTLQLVIDAQQGRHEYLSRTDIIDRIEAAGAAASETLGADVDGIEHTALAEQLTAVVGDEQFIKTIDEVADHEGLIVGESTAVAEAFERQVDDTVSSVVPDDDWNTAAKAFVTALQRELISTEVETGSLVDVGRTALQDGAFETAETMLELSREIAHEIDDSAAEAVALVALGDGALRSGHLDPAEAYYQEALDAAREIGDSTTEATALAGLGNTAVQDDALETADEFHREALEIAREIGDRSAEANSLATLGTIGGSRGEYELATQYLEESLDIKRLIGDAVGEATVLASLGNVALGRDADEHAAQHYTEALEQFTETDQPREQIQTIQNLAMVEQERGNDAAAIDYCEEGLELLAGTELTGLDETDRWFRTTRAQLTGDPDAVEALYRTALDRIGEADDPAAFELLAGVWDCRESFEPGSQPHSLCLRGGVGFAAYHLLLDAEAVETTHTEISAEISRHRETLSEPAAVLFEFVTSDGASRDTEISTEAVGDGDQSTDALERRTYGAFLSRISETPPPSELYSRALTSIVGDGDPREVVQLCLVAWERRADTDDLQSILGSMLLAEAHRELFDFRLPFDSSDAFDRISEDRAMLSEPMAALFAQLATGETETTPDALFAAADTESPSLTDVERMVVARLLDGLQS